MILFFFSSRRRHTMCGRDWSSDVCSSDLESAGLHGPDRQVNRAETQAFPGGKFNLPEEVRFGHHFHRAEENLRHPPLDRKSTRLNSSHVRISYAVFCLKKKKQYNT